MKWSSRCVVSPEAIKAGALFDSLVMVAPYDAVRATVGILKIRVPTEPDPSSDGVEMMVLGTADKEAE
jgi:hypothetical protein